MTTRGIRGAITIESDSAENVLSATCKLLEAILEANPDLQPDDVSSILFTVTEDIASIFPGAAGRQMGWDMVPVICASEIPVPGSLPLCIRVLIHWNTEKEQSAIKHAYLRDAVKLRPDLVARA